MHKHPAGYRTTEVVACTIQDSKVKLVRNAEDTSREETIKRTFAGSRVEMRENDSRI